MDYDDFDIESKFLRNMPIFIHVRFLPSIMLCFIRTESIRYILKKKIKSNYFHEKFYIVLVTKVSMAVFYNEIVGITRVLKAWVMVLSLRWFSYHCLSSLNMFHFVLLWCTLHGTQTQGDHDVFQFYLIINLLITTSISSKYRTQVCSERCLWKRDHVS